MNWLSPTQSNPTQPHPIRANPTRPTRPNPTRPAPNQPAMALFDRSFLRQVKIKLKLTTGIKIVLC